MNRERMTDETLDLLMTAWLDERAHGPAADPVLAAALSRTRRARPTPGWLLPERWLPRPLATGIASAPRLLPVLLVIGLLLAAAVAIAVVGSQRRLPPPFGLATPGLVAFVADGDLWTANPDGSNQIRLTTDPRIDGFPVFSRDGTRIAFKRLPVESSRTDWEDWGDIVVADTDGSHPIVLDPEVHSPSPVTWSGDGRSLVYSRTVDGVDQVFIAATDGSLRRQVTTGDLDNWGPTLSPDSQTIAFVRSNVGIFVIRTDGTGERQIAAGPIEQFEFAEWSPDGSTLLYSARAADHTPDVWSVGLDGQPPHPLVASPYEEYGATWSPDGQWIAYLSWAGGHRVTVARADGSNPRPISEPGVWRYPQWSPDARHVLAVDGRDGGSQPIVAILDPLGIAPMTSFAIPDVPGLGRADSASWQRLALP